MWWVRAQGLETTATNPHPGKPDEFSTRRRYAQPFGTVRVAVVGCGIVGVTSAYELALLGHEVTVLERRASVAEECSFANAGVLAVGTVAPWAAPIGRRGWALVSQAPWLWRHWRAGRPDVHAANRAAMLRLAQFSRDRLLELTRTLHLDYEQMPGYLVLLRSERDLQTAQHSLHLMRELGVPHDVVDAARCRVLEPGLNPDQALHAAIHLPQDGLGNCRQFAQLIKAQAQRLGAEFRFDTDVRALHPGARPSLETSDGQRREFDAVVVCAGVQATALLRRIGIKLPLTPVYGYSVTASIRHVDGQAPMGPRAALMDERHKVALVRLKQRIRVAGLAEMGGAPEALNPAALRTLYRVLEDWFPGAAITHKAQHWKGGRPMLPDGPPVLGASGAPGVWLNLGHGSSGWAMACGSARVLADCISGRAPPLDISRLSVARLR